MLLNNQIHQNKDSKLVPVVFIHGLFGSLTNLGMLARHFMEGRTVVQLDIRNHGLSGHDQDLSYTLMAKDVLETLDALGIQDFVAIGHSMGGKIAMVLADLTQDRMQQLIVLDMAPVQYSENHHDQIFKALFAVEEANVASRAQATEVMSLYIKENSVIQFLLKSFNKGQWLFNLKALYTHYSDILSWQTLAPHALNTLFLKGGRSFYISQPEHFQAIAVQFPNHHVKTIEDAGHWLHAEKRTEVLTAIDEFLVKA